MSHLIYDPGTGTVLAATDALLVDIAELENQVGPDADVLLSEEDNDTQRIASDIGYPLIDTGRSPVHLTLHSDGLQQAVADSLHDVDEVLGSRRDRSLAEIINTSINHIIYHSDVIQSRARWVSTVHISSDLVEPMMSGHDDTALAVTVWLHNSRGGFLTEQVQYHPVGVLPGERQEPTDEFLVDQIRMALLTAVAAANSNIAADYAFMQGTV